MMQYLIHQLSAQWTASNSTMEIVSNHVHDTAAKHVDTVGLSHTALVRHNSTAPVQIAADRQLQLSSAPASYSRLQAAAFGAGSGAGSGAGVDVDPSMPKAPSPSSAPTGLSYIILNRCPCRGSAVASGRDHTSSRGIHHIHDRCQWAGVNAPPGRTPPWSPPPKPLPGACTDGSGGALCTAGGTLCKAATALARPYFH